MDQTGWITLLVVLVILAAIVSYAMYRSNLRKLGGNITMDVSKFNAADIPDPIMFND